MATTAKPPSIVILGPDQPGGMSALFDTYRRSTLSDRYRLRFVTTTNNGNRAGRLLLGVAAVFKVVSFALSRPRPLFHIHSASGMSFRRKSVLLVIVRALGCRSILHLHSGAFVGWATGGSGLRKRVVNRLLRLPDALVVLSPIWRDALADAFQIEDAIVIPNPVRIPEGLSEDARRDLVLFSGRLIPLKRVCDLVDAAGILQESGSSSEFVIAGVGPELERIRAQVAGLPKPELVSTPGWLPWDELEGLLRQSKVFCLPSLTEGQPLALLEAMAAGVACVATSVGGIPALVTDKATGLLVEPQRPEQIADAIQFLLEHPEERLRLSQAGREHISRNFGEEAALAELESLYSRLGYPPATGRLEATTRRQSP